MKYKCLDILSYFVSSLRTEFICKKNIVISVTNGIDWRTSGNKIFIISLTGSQPDMITWLFWSPHLSVSEICQTATHLLVQIHYWCTSLMWKIVKMPIADWLAYHPSLYIDIGFGLRRKRRRNCWRLIFIRIMN